MPGRIIVIGHTDDQPLRSLRFADNSELSRARAVAVAELLKPALAMPRPHRMVGRGLDPAALQAGSNAARTAPATAASRSFTSRESPWRSSPMNALFLKRVGCGCCWRCPHFAASSGSAGRMSRFADTRRSSRRWRLIIAIALLIVLWGTEAPAARKSRPRAPAGRLVQAVARQEEPATARAAADAAAAQRFEEAIAALQQVAPGQDEPLRTALVHHHRAAGCRQDDGARQFGAEFSARAERSARRRCAVWAARATATGGSPTRRSCSTRPAATPRRTRTSRAIAAGWVEFLDAAEASTAGGGRSTACCVAISLADLADASRRGARAPRRRRPRAAGRAAQRARSAAAGVLLFTKGDLVAGFTEFFDDLDRKGREQVWGTTFPWTSRAPVRPPSGSPSSSTLLVERLNARMLDRLEAERDAGRRAAGVRFSAAARRPHDAPGRLRPRMFGAPHSISGVWLRGRVLHERHAGRHPDRSHARVRSRGPLASA